MPPSSAAAACPSGSCRPCGAGAPGFRESRELESIERDLPGWEERRRELEHLLATPSAGDYGRLEQLTRELAALVERIGAAEERWLALSELAG